MVSVVSFLVFFVVLSFLLGGAAFVFWLSLTGLRIVLSRWVEPDMRDVDGLNVEVTERHDS